MPGVFPDHPAPVIRNMGDGTGLVSMRWGMPPPPRTGGPPVTNVRNTSSPHWRMWLKPETRCLVPANSFAEYARSQTRRRTERRCLVCAEREPAAFLIRRHLDSTVTAARSLSQCLARIRFRVSDDRAQGYCRADPPQGDAGHPHDRRRARCLAARVLGGGESLAASPAR
jgi:hypothetical protein